MSEIKNGGPAFPTAMAEGMTLRDWFAGQAMQSLLREANPKSKTWLLDASTAYEIADEMLKAREANK